ncbi:MAG: hypothetical protein ACXV7G_13555 [Halobacteriota archaeon]
MTRGGASGAYGAAEVLKSEYGLKMYPLALIALAKTRENPLTNALWRRWTSATLRGALRWSGSLY